MKKKVMYLIVGISVLCLILVSVLMFINKDNKKEKETNEYALKFKEEYEQFNNKKNSRGQEYLNLTISEDNPIMYSNYNEIINIIDSKTGVIYFGFPECPWCRNAVSVLLESAKYNGVEEIYYLNIQDMRDQYEVRDNELVKTKEAGEGYYELLEALDEILEDYIVSDINTGVKRLYAPTVVFVKNGEIIGHHVATVDLNENQTKYDPLTKEQFNQLKDIYDYYMEQTFNDYCTEAC